MKPTELRIGDYVKYQGHIYIIEEISAKGWVHLIYPKTKIRVNMTSDYIIDLLEPIPFTPKIPEKGKVEKPNGGIVLEDFNEGDGFYKVNLAYLNKEQVEEIESLVKKWNP